MIELGVQSNKTERRYNENENTWQVGWSQKLLWPWVKKNIVAKRISMIKK
jgi:hypothetical protein